MQLVLKVQEAYQVHIYSKKISFAFILESTTIEPAFTGSLSYDITIISLDSSIAPYTHTGTFTPTFTSTTPLPETLVVDETLAVAINSPAIFRVDEIRFNTSGSNPGFNPFIDGIV